MDMTKIDTLNGVTSLFEHAASEFLAKGYYRMPDEHDYFNRAAYDRDPIIPPMTLRKFVRRVAKENNRPFIRIWNHYENRQVVHPGETHPRYEHYQRGIGVEIPKRKFTAPLIHCLHAAGFSRSSEVTLWTYAINDDDFAQEYLSFFETREEFRRACRLPV